MPVTEQVQLPLIDGRLLDEVLADIHECGRALVRFIRPNDVGATGSHQAGFHLPKDAWQFYSSRPPEKGVNFEIPTQVLWSDGTLTESTVKWYGTGTRSEFRLTNFNRIRDFWPRDVGNIGALLILVRVRDGRWHGYVLDAESNIEAVAAEFGFDLVARNWAEFDDTSSASPASIESLGAEPTVSALLAEAQSDSRLPATKVMASAAQDVVNRRLRPGAMDADELLIEYTTTEFEIFKLLEEALYTDQVGEGFESISDFLALAQTITQSRKSRAGRSLELHVAEILRRSGLSFDEQPVLDGTEPDFILPGTAAYPEDANGREPFVVAIKTTCRDRWRQVLREAPRVAKRYLLTTQHGMSDGQALDIAAAGIQLVVPKQLHADFAEQGAATLWTLERFLTEAHARFAP